MATFDRIWIDGGGTNVRAIGERGGRRTTLFSMPTRPWAVVTAVRRVSRRVKRGGDLVVGLRGVWTSAEKNVWKKKLPKAAFRVQVMSDIELAHAMAFGQGPGIVLNAGTGSIAFGRNKKGKTARAGGLGPLLGDEGSAFWIGREYVRRVESRRLKFEALRALVRNDNPVAAIASRSKAALKAARRGGEARQIVMEARAALQALVREVHQKVGGGRFPVVLRGGLFEDRFFRELFTGDTHGR